MTLNEYQVLAQRTSNDDADKLLNGCMGMCGEAGECIDIMKKHRMQGHALAKDKLPCKNADENAFGCRYIKGLY